MSDLSIFEHDRDNPGADHALRGGHVGRTKEMRQDVGGAGKPFDL